MLLRVPSRCLSLGLLATAALGGCTDHRAHFADATPAQLERAYSASSGSDLGMATLLAAFITFGDNTSCPTVVTKDQDTTVSGGCTMEDGTRVDGSIAIHNLSGLIGKDPAQPSSIRFDHYVMSAKHGPLTFDGSVELGKSGVSGDLTVDAEGISSTSHLTLACNVDGTCTASSGSEIEISDLGSAGVEGTWSLTDPPSGRVTVRGADVLTFDLAGSDEKGCVPYTVASKSGTVCLPTADEGGDQALAGNRLQR
jgi:hypothetical protein